MTPKNYQRFHIWYSTPGFVSPARCCFGEPDADRYKDALGPGKRKWHRSACNCAESPTITSWRPIRERRV